MKQDLDALMAERHLDALMVVKEGHDPNMPISYLTGGASLGRALLIKRRGSAPVLICGAFEREEAAKSGLETHIFGEFDPAGIREAAKDDPVKMQALLWSRLFDEYGVTGRVGFYGSSNPAQSFHVLTMLTQMRGDFEVAVEPDTDIFLAAARTKDADELARLIDVGRRTSAVVGETLDFLRGHAVKDQTLTRADGAPLRIGDAKRFVRARLLEHDLEDSEGMIFAQGASAGVPHSAGEDGDPVRLGAPIVFDLFPREIGGGYFHDMTRTWCLGHAPDAVQEAYEHVMEAFNAVRPAFKVGAKCAVYQEMVCDVFERHGHQTIRQDETILEGYIHSLGHGIGLNIHEAPRFSHRATDDIIEIGNVFTVEPGLYYPDRGFGVRIEDSVYVDADGAVRSLTDFPKDLVIPMS
ncbi:MAG: hypothetical protein Kow00120_18840 [Anaerolineae bacterium]